MEYGGGGSKVSNTVCAYYRVVQDIESVLYGERGEFFRFKQSIIVLVAAAAEAFTNVVIVVVYLFVQILLFLLLLGFFACNCLIPLFSFFTFLPLFD